MDINEINAVYDNYMNQLKVMDVNTENVLYIQHIKDVSISLLKIVDEMYFVYRKMYDTILNDKDAKASYLQIISHNINDLIQSIPTFSRNKIFSFKKDYDDAIEDFYLALKYILIHDVHVQKLKSLRDQIESIRVG